MNYRTVNMSQIAGYPFDMSVVDVAAVDGGGGDSDGGGAVDSVLVIE